jgi:ketosteroid isomerase-like protein
MPVETSTPTSTRPETLPGRVNERSSAQIARQVEIVKLLFDAFARRDVDAALELMDPKIRFMPMTAKFAHEGRPYEGHAGIREYFEDAEALWQKLELVPFEYQAVVGAVVVIGEVHGRGANGELRAPAVWTWKLRGQRIVEGSIHSDPASARKALGENLAS